MGWDVRIGVIRARGGGYGFVPAASISAVLPGWSGPLSWCGGMPLWSGGFGGVERHFEQGGFGTVDAYSQQVGDAHQAFGGGSAV